MVSTFHNRNETNARTTLSSIHVFSRNSLILTLTVRVPVYLISPFRNTYLLLIHKRIALIVALQYSLCVPTAAAYGGRRRHRLHCNNSSDDNRSVLFPDRQWCSHKW